MSVKTRRPHSMPAAAFTGVLKVKYCTASGAMLWIQLRDSVGLTEVTVCLPSWMEICPLVIEACTFTSQSARAAPFGNEVSISVVKGSGKLPCRTQLATVGQGAGPFCSHTLCQCEANTRPPLLA